MNWDCKLQPEEAPDEAPDPMPDDEPERSEMVAADLTNILPACSRCGGDPCRPGFRVCADCCLDLERQERI